MDNNMPQAWSEDYFKKEYLVKTMAKVSGTISFCSITLIFFKDFHFHKLMNKK